MHLAIINEQTNIVENIIVPPEGAQAWFTPAGYYAVMTDEPCNGFTYDPITETFTAPEELDGE